MSLYIQLIFFLVNLCVLCLCSLSVGEPGYEYLPHLHGCLKLHKQSADWLTANNNCLLEGAQLAAPWKQEFIDAVNELQSKDGQLFPRVFSGARITLPHFDGEPFLSEEESNWDRCGTFVSGGGTGDDRCSKRLPFVCYARASASACVSKQDRPGYAYSDPVNGWLKLHLTPADWNDARVSCHMEDAFLASPWTAEFSRVVNSYSIPLLYSGLLVKYTEGAYSYVKEEAAILQEPSDMAELERCGVWYANGSTGDVPCTERLPFVCYIPVSEAAPAPAPTFTHDPSCGAKSLGYELADQTGRCYKFHRQAALWDDANRTCVAEGANLVVPSTLKETKVLTALYERNPEEVIRGAWHDNYVAIGIYWDSKIWRTVDGRTLDQLEYKDWMPGEPSGAYINVSYLFMNRDGKLNNYVYIGVPFICEKRPLTAPTGVVRKSVFDD